jgi:hypothetical protein
MLDTPTRVALPAKQHPDYMGTDKDGYVALSAGWRGASPTLGLRRFKQQQAADSR